LVFIDLKHLIPERWIEILLSFQFVPSIIQYFDAGTLLSASFLIVLVLTFVTGKTYCSFLCPLGIVQDINSRIGGRFKKKFRRFGYRKPNTILRYTILAALLIMTIFSSVYLLTLLDPYSIFGRGMLYFVNPFISIFNNFLASILEKFDIYSLARVKLVGFPLSTYIIPGLFFLLIGIMSFMKGRLYCNTVCPVGTFLGLIAKISIFRIKFDKSKCLRCGRCAVSCKSSCIDFMKNEVDLSRCVNCFDCIKTCPEKAISYGLLNLKNDPPLSKGDENGSDEGINRRKFITGSIALAIGVPSVTRAQEPNIVPIVASTVREERNNPVTPPGAGNFDDFNAKCTACSLCISVCPTNVLRPSLKEYGIWGMMQPVMNYGKGFCDYDCIACSEVCPTNALSLLTVEAKKRTKLGVSHFIKDNCIVKIGKTPCGACSESCPTKAVYLVPYEGNLLIPEVDPSLCIGCGHCEYSCPMTPFKAIYVDGSPVHGMSRQPRTEKPDQSGIDDFPF
jgi:ferredoxin